MKKNIKKILMLLTIIGIGDPDFDRREVGEKGDEVPRTQPWGPAELLVLVKSEGEVPSLTQTNQDKTACR